MADHAPRAKDFTNKKGSRYVTLSDRDRAKNRNKSQVRAKVEYVFSVMKGQFGFTKVRYKGLDKKCPSFIYILYAGEFGHGEKDSATTTMVINAGLVRLLHAHQAGNSGLMDRNGLV